ncbi:MAG TPA: beta-phosphoglucomutase [Xanthomonadales bacterium]|nr:beta-phosphoglucomutase [Xanthomonadales bacterium]
MPVSRNIHDPIEPRPAERNAAECHPQPAAAGDLDDGCASVEGLERADGLERDDGSDHSERAWRLRQIGYQADREGHYGTLFALANGHLGVRGGCEEAGGSGGCFLAPVYQRSPIHYHERFPGFAAATDTRLPVADGSVFTLAAEGRVLRPGDDACRHFRRELDLRRGVLTRRTDWRLSDGVRVSLRSERLVSSEIPGLLALRWRLRVEQGQAQLALSLALLADRAAPAQGDDPRIGIGQGIGMQTRGCGLDGGDAWLVQETPDRAFRVACVQRLRVVDQDRAAVTVARSADPQVATGRRVECLLADGQEIVLDVLVGYAWSASASADGSADDATLRAAARSQLDQAGERGFERLVADQQRALAAFWCGADCAIEGDPAAERALRFNLFHLWQSTGRGGLTSTAAKGLTGDGYEGHYFWDTEAYMLPVLALTAPELARGMLQYRRHTLDAARRHAREMNHPRGALFAWRTISGDECSAYYPSGSAQYHINAAIAHALRVYEQASGDFRFIAETGAEVLFETARLWLEVGHFDARRDGAFCICEVTGPDEYSALVDNNFYTNRMARAHLLHAVATWQRLGRECPADQARLAAVLELDSDEVERWRVAATAMYLPYDPVLGIHPQDDGFLGKPLWDFANTPAEHYPLLLHYHPLTLYRHQVCKQADVVLALVMDGADIDPAVKRRCFDYYSRVTVHDSTLSAAPFSILAAELGDGEAALTLFEETVAVDLDDRHGNSDHGAHMAAMAGSWQCLLFGFLGLRIDPAGPHFAPSLPARWRGYRTRLHWQGRRLEIVVSPARVEYRLLDGGPLTVFDRGQPLRLASDAAIERPLASAGAWPLLASAQPFEAVIFDLDGVLTDTAELHYRAWKQLADDLDIAFDRRGNHRLKGVDRMRSLDLLLDSAGRRVSESERLALAERKNRHYRALIDSLGPGDLLPGAAECLTALRAAGIRIGLASASRNAPAVLERLGIADRFDYIADPARIEAGKPDPAIFLAAARGLGVAPHACLGVEDAAAGIAAIKAAGMTALGIGDRRDLPGADAVLAGLSQFRIDTVPLRRATSSDDAARFSATANERNSA